MYRQGLDLVGKLLITLTGLCILMLNNKTMASVVASSESTLGFSIERAADEIKLKTWLACTEAIARVE